MGSNEQQITQDQSNVVETAQKAAQGVQEGMKAAEDSAKLAADIASANAVGIAKDSINLLKNKKFRQILKIVLVVVICMNLLILGFIGVLAEVGSELVDLVGQAATSAAGFLQKTWKDLTDDYWIDIGKEYEYIVDVDTDEILGVEGSVSDEVLSGRNTEVQTYTLVDAYLKALGENGYSLKDLRLLGGAEYSGNIFEDEENKEIVEKYLAEFIRADIITSQPHRREGTALVSDKNQNLLDGGIYIYRTEREETVSDEDLRDGSYSDTKSEDVNENEYIQMTYMEYEEFLKLLGSDGEDQKTSYPLTANAANTLRYKYTIDPNTSELLFVEIKTTEVATSEVEVGNWFLGGAVSELSRWLQEANKDITYEARLVKQNYMNLISQYSMPYEFLITLCAVTQNPEFVYHVALLARETNIVLVIHDNATIEMETVEVEEDKQDYRNDSSNSTSGASITNQRTIKTRTITKKTTETPVLGVLEADTWSFYDQLTYKRTITGTKNDTDIIVGGGNVRDTLSSYHPEEEIITDYSDITGEPIYVTRPEYWTDTFTTQTRTRTQTVTVTTDYDDPVEKSVEKSKQFLGLLRNSTGECPEDCYEETAWRREVPVAVECVHQSEFDRQGEDVEYRLSISTEKEAPIDKLLSGLDILYSMLQANYSGDEEDKKVTEESQIVEEQNRYIAEEDYESAYVVEMQGLVEHMRYLMTFPDEPTYTKLELNIGNWFFPENEEDEDVSDIIHDEGTIASAREIYDFLVGKGMTPEAACGILGNIEQESSFVTSASNGTHFGLCQWGGGRWENLKNFAADRGTSWTNLNTQLEFLWNELENGYSHVKNAIMNCTDVEEATEIFCKKFEVCGNYGTEVPKRYKYALNWYNQFVKGTSNEEGLSNRQNELLTVLNNLSDYTGIINRDGYCQAFVRTVFEKIGITASASSASNAEKQWKVSTDMSNIPVGATVYGEGSSADGHVGIYIGNGKVVHNIGNSHNCSYGGLRGIKCESIEAWDSKYTFTSWGWQGGIALTN